MAKNSVTQLRTRVRDSLADGRVTDAETRSLIRAAAKDTLTKREQDALQSAFGKQKDKFDPDAALRMARFIRATDGRARAADPSVMTHDSRSLDYSRAKGPVVKDGIRASDVAQGHAGDCYLLASLSAAARMRPNLIKDAIIQREDGGLAVRFHEKTADGKFRPVYVKLDRELPFEKRTGRLHYARGRNSRELWVSLVEKAFAKWKGGYERIGQGGSTASAMESLTGRPARGMGTRDRAAATVYAELETHLRAKGLAAASTGDNEARYRRTGLVKSHAYTITGVSESNGRKYVHLRNPWGRYEPGTQGGDGAFKLSLARFVKHLDHVSLG